jgi:hypothetical protein
MLAQELFVELCIDNTDFNGDVELMEDGTIVWSYNYEPEVIELEEGEEQETEEEFVGDALELFEDDADFIFDLLEEFEEELEDFDYEDEFTFDGKTLKIEMYLFEDEE